MEQSPATLERSTIQSNLQQQIGYSNNGVLDKGDGDFFPFFLHLAINVNRHGHGVCGDDHVRAGAVMRSGRKRKYASGVEVMERQTADFAFRLNGMEWKRLLCLLLYHQ